MPGKTKLRIARPVTDINATSAQYTAAFGLSVIFTFKDHDGFDGVMLGHKDHDWHFEFTHSHTHAIAPTPTVEDLVVFYYPDEKEWSEVVAKAEAAGFNKVKSFNPYWDVNGVTVEDKDGYRVVIQRAEWSL